MSKKQQKQALSGKSAIPVPTEPAESPSARQALANALTALRESEAKYRELVQLANSAIIRWKCDGTITLFNEYAQSFFGYRADEAVGKNIGMLVPEFESTGADLRAIVRDIVRHPERYEQFVNENVCRDGRRVWMAWTNRPILDKQGRVIEMLSIGMDITALKKAEAELKTLTTQLEQRVRERTVELSRTILTLQEEVKRRTQAEDALRRRSEQLRNLASELTLAEQRERRRLAEVLHDNLQQLLVGAKLRLSMLDRQVEPSVVQKVVQDVQDLLDESIDCSRSLTGELSPPILHQGGLPAALEWLAGWMKQKHAMAVDLDLDKSADPSSEDMRVLLFQSTRELLFNAVKHANVDNVRVHLKRNAGDVEVMVADEGAGFNPATIMPQSGESTGGFGLFSIRERLDLLGGKLEIQSAPGQGSRFRMLAPIGVDEADTGRDAAAFTDISISGLTGLAEAAGEAYDPDPRIRVLLVDDHVVVRQGLCHLLQEEPDIEVVGEASDGAAAIDMARRLVPDVIMMDVNMPRMDGVEATRIICAKNPSVSVIGLSMFEEADLADRMRQAGAVDYLTKSGPSHELLAAIRTCAGAKNPRHES